MPELPEIETFRRGLERETVGRRVKSVEVPIAKAVHRNGSRKAFQGRLEGTKIRSIDRRGSLLVFTLDSGDLMVVDIGAAGRLERAAPKDETAKDTQIIINFTQGGQLRMADPEQAAEAFAVTAELLTEEMPELTILGLDPVASPMTATIITQPAATDNGSG
jgi:formamidopyrimidine-DNA glycosylase